MIGGVKRRLFGHTNIDELRASKNVKALTKASKNKDADIRSKAAEALGDIGDTRAVEPLVALLRDKDRNVRWQAAGALEKLGWVPKNEAERVTSLIAMHRWDELVKSQEPCIKALLTAYEKADPYLIPYPLAALWEIGKPAVPILINTLKDKSARRAARGVAAGALGGIDDPRSIEALLNCYTDKKEKRDYREAVGLSLELQGKKALAPIMSALMSGKLMWDVLAQTVAILGHLGKPGVKGLINALRHEKVAVRCAAVFALLATGDPAAIEALDYMPPDEDATLRNDIRYHLKYFNPPSLKRLLANIKGKSVPPDLVTGARKFSAIALGNTGDCKAVESLTLAAKSDSDDGVRFSASFSLGNLINCPGVRDTLLQMLGAEDHRERLLATYGLKAGGASVLRYL